MRRNNCSRFTSIIETRILLLYQLKTDALYIEERITKLTLLANFNRLYNTCEFALLLTYFTTRTRPTTYTYTVSAACPSRFAPLLLLLFPPPSARTIIFFFFCFLIIIYGEARLRRTRAILRVSYYDSFTTVDTLFSVSSILARSVGHERNRHNLAIVEFVW